MTESITLQRRQLASWVYGLSQTQRASAAAAAKTDASTVAPAERWALDSAPEPAGTIPALAAPRALATGEFEGVEPEPTVFERTRLAKLVSSDTCS